jgi:hypothetical protein
MELPEYTLDPFEELARSLAQAAEIEAILDEAMIPDTAPDLLLDLADAKARLMRQQRLLVRDWRWELGQTYPASN